MEGEWSYHGVNHAPTSKSSNEVFCLQRSVLKILPLGLLTRILPLV